MSASPISSLKPNPSSITMPSWMEPMKALTVNGLIFDLAALITALMKAS